MRSGPDRAFAPIALRACVATLASCLVLGLAGCPAEPDHKVADQSDVARSAPVAVPGRVDRQASFRFGYAADAPVEAVAATSFHFEELPYVKLAELWVVNSALVADIDGDRRNDVILLISFSGQGGLSDCLLVYRQGVNGEMLPADKVSLRWPVDHSSVSAGDMDGDDVDDIIVGDMDGVTIVRWKRNLGYLTKLVGYAPCNHNGVLDVDLDGKLDVVCLRAGWLATYYGDGQGDVSRIADLDLGNKAFYDLKVGDVTGDGRPDVVMFEDGVTSGLHVYPHANGPGLASVVTYPLADASPDPGSPDVNYWGIAIGDFNGDGRKDVAIANSNELDAQYRRTFVIMHQAVNGTMLAPVTKYLAGGGYVGEMVSADFDRDGDDDLVVRRANETGFSYHQQQSGSLLAGVYVQMLTGNPETNDSLAVGDINRDQCPDLVYATGLGLAIAKGVGCARARRLLGGPGQRSRTGG
jgi:hypothetical protein